MCGKACNGEGGKGCWYRPVSREALDIFWSGWCKKHGHRFVNRRCVYCGKSKEATENKRPD